jgi:hypothetical protein
MNPDACGAGMLTVLSFSSEFSAKGWESKRRELWIHSPVLKYPHELMVENY